MLLLDREWVLCVLRERERHSGADVGVVVFIFLCLVVSRDDVAEKLRQ